MVSSCFSRWVRQLSNSCSASASDSSSRSSESASRSSSPDSREFIEVISCFRAACFFRISRAWSASDQKSGFSDCSESLCNSFSLFSMSKITSKVCCSPFTGCEAFFLLRCHINSPFLDFFEDEYFNNIFIFSPQANQDQIDADRSCK